jgi:ribosomal protein S26
MTKEEYIANAEDVTYLASCMVRGEKPDAERVAKMDLKQLYKTSNTHLLTGIVGYALEEADVHDPEFVQAKSKAIRKIVLFVVERAAILAELEKAGIWHMPPGDVVSRPYVCIPSVGRKHCVSCQTHHSCVRSVKDARRGTRGAPGRIPHRQAGAAWGPEGEGPDVRKGARQS